MVPKRVFSWGKDTFWLFNVLSRKLFRGGSSIYEVKLTIQQMKYHADTKVEPEFLRITATGEYAVQDLFAFIAFVRHECEKAGKDRVLIDCSALTGQMSEVDRFYGGQKIAEVFGSAIQAALVMPPSNITKLGEMAASNRGARLLVTSSPTEALEWLLNS
jgi:hypothetical protein